MITAIVAYAENKVIGKDDQLIWHLPADLKRFKTITSGFPIVMGRKTFESIGKPLPNRTNIVITKDENWKAEGVLVFNSIEEAVEKGKELNENVFIIGGGSIYKQSLPLCDVLEITEVHHDFEGDAFFPEFNQEEWKEVNREFHHADDKNLYDYSFVRLERK